MLQGDVAVRCGGCHGSKLRDLVASKLSLGVVPVGKKVGGEDAEFG